MRFRIQVITASSASSKTPSGENLLDARTVYNYVTSSDNNSSGLEGGLGGGVNGASNGNLLSNSGTEKSKFSFFAFLGDILRFHDVIGAITYKGELYQSLSPAAC